MFNMDHTRGNSSRVHYRLEYVMDYVALFCRKDSDYKQRDGWDVYDADRDALSYRGNLPAVCHPPCRLWGRLSHMACRDAGITQQDKDAEKRLAIWSVDLVRYRGGVVEHPAGSKLFEALPQVGELDAYGGFVIEIDQYDFGHVAHKQTKLYICGCRKEDLPTLPPKDTSIHLCEKGKKRSICGNVEGTTRCTQKQREYTPEKLIDWLEEVLTVIRSM